MLDLPTRLRQMARAAPHGLPTANVSLQFVTAWATIDGIPGVLKLSLHCRRRTSDGDDATRGGGRAGGRMCFSGSFGSRPRAEPARDEARPDAGLVSRLHALIRPHDNEWRHLKVEWLTDVVAARKKAAAEDKPIVICYTGGAGYNEPLGRLLKRRVSPPVRWFGPVHRRGDQAPQREVRLLRPRLVHQHQGRRLSGSVEAVLRRQARPDEGNGWLRGTQLVLMTSSGRLLAGSVKDRDGLAQGAPGSAGRLREAAGGGAAARSRWTARSSRSRRRRRAGWC